MSADERRIIAESFERAVHEQHLSGSGVQPESDSPSALLVMLAETLHSPAHRAIVERLAQKAVALARRDHRVTDLHFAYLHLIMVYARERHTSDTARSRLEEACRSQIDVAPTMARIFGYPNLQLPPHIGYQMLATVLEEEGRYGEALDVIREARDRGWYGDWNERIGRCRARMPLSNAVLRPNYAAGH